RDHPHLHSFPTRRSSDLRQRNRIRMTAISYVNSLLVDEPKKRRARTHARFVNTAMMATLDGAVISDGLEDGRVVSGVGGQHDFVDRKSTRLNSSHVKISY